MSNDLDMIMRTDKKIVYRLGSFDLFDERLVRNIAWPSGISGAVIVFDRFGPDETKTLSGLPLDLDVGMVYSASKNTFKEEAFVHESGIRPVKILSERALSELYLACRDRVLAPIAQVRPQPPISMPSVLEKMARQLREAKIGCWELDGKPIAAIVLSRWHDYADRPVEWIPWVWIEEHLRGDLRKEVHSRIAAWLNSNVVDRVQCVVDAYNVRSQKFFKKLGFVPECVHIVKP